MLAEQPQPTQQAGAPRGMGKAMIGTGIVSVVGLFVGLATSALLARALGPAGRGEYAAVLAWPNILFTIGLIGLPSATTFYTASDPAYANTWRANALWLALVGWAASSVLCWFTMPWLLAAQSATTIMTARLFGLVFGLANVAWTIGVSSLQGLRAFKAWNIIRIAQIFLWLAVLFVCILLGIRSVRVLALLYGVCFLALTPVAFVTGRRGSAPSLNIKVGRHLLKYGLSAMLATLPGLLNRRLDQMLMATFIRPEILGLYAVAAALTIPLSVLTAPIASVIMPSIAGTDGKSEKANLLARTSRATTLFLLLAGIALMAVVPVLIPLIFGQRFQAAIGPAIVLSVAAMVLGVVTVLEDALMGAGHPRAMMKAELNSLVFTAVGLLVTLPRWPLIGPAAVSLLAYSLSLFVMVRECRTILGLTARDLLMPGREEWMLLRGWIGRAVGSVGIGPGPKELQ